MFRIFLLFFVSLSVAIDRVLTPPPIITAGSPAVIEFNLSASSCNSSFSSDRGCDWPFLTPWLTADPNHPPDGFFVVQQQCFLTPCVTTNLSNFEITLPPSAVPDGSRYALAFLLFKFRDNGTVDTYYPTFSGFGSDHFNITGANSTWTDLDVTSGYQQAAGNRPWFWNVSCAALECARDCTDKFVGPKIPYVAGPIPELDACVEACPGYGWDPTECIKENAILTSSTTSSSIPTSTLASSGSSSTSPSASPSASPSSSSHLTVPGTMGRMPWLVSLVVTAIACC
ncbi:hypothetical protein F4821DRAFT_93730 [Hypoxylon rubiginosum]|uniref:Uncharacterized protein n=1 Tax=Hypoxylon rubiginosum TaxID=110542 RepID=A0ACC0D6M8_9PEZI|nr:hypothetical protein F4821DRAFT_93730 [Hypoxylon rubiginosum]